MRRLQRSLEITTDAATSHAQRLCAPVLPGLVDAHSHAFQRAFCRAGRTARSADDFWSWRDRMYARGAAHHAGAVRARWRRSSMPSCCGRRLHAGLRGSTPAKRDLDGCPTGPVDHQPTPRPMPASVRPCCWLLYQRAGFAQPCSRDDQRRLPPTPRRCARCNAAWRQRRPLLNAGVAIHSLRAAEPAGHRPARRRPGRRAGAHPRGRADGRGGRRLQATGLRPVEWLCRHGAPDARWQLVHATHATPAEIEAVARRGAGVVICPAPRPTWATG